MAIQGIELPEQAFTWMTPEIRELLSAITGRHAPKKRRTIIKLAFALANRELVKDVFSQPDCCSESVWYSRWQHDEKIKAAFDACCKRAINWNDEDLAAIQAHFTRKRREAIAKHAAEAPGALATVMLSEDEKGADRISAANSLLQWADPEAVQKSGGGPPPPAGSNDVNINFAAWSDEEFDQYILNLSALIEAQKAEAEAQAEATEGE